MQRGSGIKSHYQEFILNKRIQVYPIVVMSTEDDEEEKNFIYDWVRILVVTLTLLTVIATLYCGLWFYRHRKNRIVLARQPIFLITISLGLFIWEISVIPLSIDDGISSQRGCDIACISFEWLRIIGFTISFAGLYSKLWRINKIFHNPQFRRIQVKPTDVIKPFAFVFTINFILLLLWTIIDPPIWVREPIYGDVELYTYGSCQSKDIGVLFNSGILFTTYIAIIATIRQAFLARNISSDFSETWPLAIGLLNWIQLLIIQLPASIIIGSTIPSAVYFLTAAFILAQCITMLLAVACPLLLHPSIRNTDHVLGENIQVTRTGTHPTVTGVTLETDTAVHNETINENMLHQICDDTAASVAEQP